jgi:hypothetical protein
MHMFGFLHGRRTPFICISSLVYCTNMLWIGHVEMILLAFSIYSIVLPPCIEIFVNVDFFNNFDHSSY